MSRALYIKNILDSGISPVDNALAELFAMDQINHELCTDPAVIKGYCKDKGQCLRWRTDTSQQLWSKPKNFNTSLECKSEADCNSFFPQCLEAENGKKYCGWDPKIPEDIVSRGVCEIATKEKCEEFSASPYTCDSSGMCELLKDARYYEWRNTEYVKCDDKENPCPSLNSKCLASGECTCTTNEDCVGSATCQDSTLTPGQKVCKGGGRCVYGNFMLRQWCENPRSRCQPSPSDNAKDCTEDKDCDPGNQCMFKKCVGPDDYPMECGGKGKVAQVTNVPPFYYDKNSGRCFMTQPYCNRFVMDFGEADGRTCTKDSDCDDSTFQKDSFCIAGKCTVDARRCRTQSECKSDEVCHEGWCTGPRSQCSNTIGGEWAGMNAIEMTMGRTVYSSIVQNPGWQKLQKDNVQKEGALNAWAEWAKGFDCKNREAFRILTDLFTPLLKDIPKTIECLVDESYIMQKEIVSTTFVDKLNVYVIVWKFSADRTKPTFGFIRSELKKVYPSLLKKSKGRWYLKMKWSQLRKEDIALKRIYILSCFGENLSKTVIEYVMSTISPDEREKLDRIIKQYDLEQYATSLNTKSKSSRNK